MNFFLPNAALIRGRCYELLSPKCGAYSRVVLNRATLIQVNTFLTQEMMGSCLKLVTKSIQCILCCIRQ